jgi:membrane protease YdiL (CAAX protease family)
VLLGGMARDGFTLGGWRVTPAVLATVSGALAGAMALGLTIDPLVKQGLPLAHILPFRGRGRGQGQARVLASGVVMGVFVFALGWVHGALLRGGMGGVPLPRDWEHPVSALLRDNPVIVLAAVVFDPLVEEIIFRALLQQGLRSTLGVRPALLLATLAFTLMHEPQTWAGVLASGLCLAWFFERTGHLGAVVLAQAVINTLHLIEWLLMR